MLKFQSFFVHPCIVDEKPHIVYPKGLRESAPATYQKLKHYFTRKGYRLKEDQRSGDSKSFYNDNRRKLATMLLFTASLLFEGSSFAEIEFDLNTPVVFQNHEVELQLVPNPELNAQIQRLSGESQNLPELSSTESKRAESIFKQLKSHYKKKPNDPGYILEDLRKMALYYSDFSEVVSLLNALDGKNWELSYNEHEWLTAATGNIFEVEKAVVNFNSRSAAQLLLNNGCKGNPVCIASPADAMLHELLHAFSMLVKTDQFIAQGGMNSVMYPYQHEYSVIESERKLYAQMSLQDTSKRPSRYEHAGRMVKASCPTCIK